MLTYTLEKTHTESLYMSLYNFIKSDIEKGVLKADEKLPSKRNFARNLSVSVITVENAYERLISEGYIYSISKKGYFVSDIGIINYISRKKDDKTENNNYNAEKIEKLPPKETYQVDFVTNRIPDENFPFAVWSKLLREVMIKTESKKLLMQSEIGGVDELKQAISEHLYNFRGIKASPWQIIVGAGGESLYSLIIQLLGRDKIYGIENPGYRKLSDIYNSNDVVNKFINLDDNGIDIKQLRKEKVDIAHISPSHHFPTGRVTSVARRYELLGWASEDKNRYIIEDDYDCEFRLYGKPVPSLQSIDAIDKVIYVNTFSKSLAPSFRISYMVLPEKLALRFYEKLGFYTCTVSNFEQYTLANFIKYGYFEKHINRMRKYYREIRDEIIAIIGKSDIKNYCEILNANEGLHFVLKINREFSDKRFVVLCAKEGIKISCLSDYYHDLENSQTGQIIISYSGIERSKVGENIKKVIECVVRSI